MGVLLLAAVAAILGGLTGCSTEPGPEVWVIGLDGADWDQLEPMMTRGEMPHLAALRAGGASGMLLSDEPMISPILWASIATGKTPDKHGITWFMSETPDGSKIPISGVERKVRSFWDIASEAGRTCGIVGWWATWPADPINGFLVSDYVAWHSFGVTGRESVDVGKTWPPEMMDLVNEVMMSPADVPDHLLTSMVHLPADQLRMKAGANPFTAPVAHLRQAIATSRGYTDLVLDRLDHERPEVMSVYYEGTDAITHLFGDFQEPRLPWVSDKDFDAYHDVVDVFWRWQDTLLGELLAERGPETTVIVVSDHGFRLGAERRHEDGFHIETADADHSPDGVIVINGPGVKVGTWLIGADIYDVAPTVLYALGLEVPDDMDGRLLTDAFEPAHLRAEPIRTVATYETSPRQRGEMVEGDDQSRQNLEQMLRSLGYLSGGNPGEASLESVPAEQAVNRAIVLMNQGRSDEAVVELRQVLADHPGQLKIRQNLAQALARSGETAESEKMFRALAKDHPKNLEIHQDLAILLGKRGDFEGARVAIQTGLDIRPDWAEGLGARGWYSFKLGQPEKALRDLRRSIDLDPRLGETYLNLGEVMAAQGDLDGAVAALEKAHGLDPGDPSTALALAGYLERNNSHPRALEALTRTLEVGGRNAAVLGEIGAIFLMMGRPAEAIAPLKESHDLDPLDPQLAGNLGMAYAMTGRPKAAIASFEEVVKIAPEIAGGHAQLGALYAEDGQMDKAMVEYALAVEKEPANAGFRLNLASIHHQTGQVNLAMDNYREAIRLDPNLAPAYYYLGLLEIRNGNSDEGQRLLARAKELDPSLPAGRGTDPVR